MALPDIRAVEPGEPLPPVDAIGAWALLVTSDNDGTVTLSQKSNRTEMARLPSAHGKAELVRFSPDGNWAAVKHARHDHAIWVVWDWRRSKVLLQAGHAPGTPWGWSPDSSCFFYGGTDGLLCVHDLVKNTDIHRIALRQAPWITKEEHVALSPDRGKLAVVGKQASATASATVQVYDLRTGQVAAEFLHPQMYTQAQVVWRVAWGPDNRLLAAACSEDLYIWDVPHKKQQAVIKNVRADWAMVFTREANILVSSGSTSLIQLSDPLIGTSLVSIPGNFGDALVGERWLPLAWPAPSGFYEVALGKECRRLHTASRDFGPHAAFHPQGRWLALADYLGVRLFDLANFREAAFLDLGRSETVLFHPGGDLLTYSGEHGLQRWPLRPDPEQPEGAMLLGPPQLLQALPARPYPNWAALGPNGQVAAADIGRRQAVLLNSDHPEERTVLGPQQGVRCVSMSPDGRWVATGHWLGKSINVWDAKTGRLVKEFPTSGNQGANVLFTPDGRWLIGCLGQEYVFWNVGPWNVDHVLQRKEQGWAGMAAVSPDHRMLAICDTVWEVKLLDLKTSREIARLPAETNGTISGLCFGPDGSQLVVARSDGALLWDLRLIRAKLADMGLDWDLPAYRARASDAPWEPIRVRVVTSNPIAAAP
jgi:WD40 repeat protein